MNNIPQISGIDVEQELRIYTSEIKRLLIKYGKTKDLEAERLINESGLFVDLDTEEDILYLFHEIPYYWAMELIHGSKNPKWFLDPELWPPPDNH
jgi:hypothetical protein